MINWQTTGNVILLKQLLIQEEVKRHQESGLMNAASQLSLPLHATDLEVQLAAAKRRMELAALYNQPSAAVQSLLATTSVPAPAQVTPPTGLDMLRAAARVSPVTTPSSPIPEVTTTAPTNKRAKNGKLYINQIRDCDVLCGRGGKSNHHPGNKKYRQVVSDMKAMYRKTETKTVKTDLSRAIVDHVCAYGGRFIKKEESTGMYFLLTKSEARKKTSQALRETKELKWTA